MMTLQEMVRILLWPVEFLKRHWMSVVVVLGVVVLVAIFKTVDLPKFGEVNLPKFDTSGIGAIPAEQWLAIAGLGILGIIVICVFRKVLGWVFLIGSIIGLALLYNFSYRAQDAVKEGSFAIKGRLNNAISYTFEPKSLRETEITVPGLVEGDYYVDIFSRKNIYTVQCPWASGQRRRAIIEEKSFSDPKIGNLLLRGKETEKEYAVSSGGVVRVGPSGVIVVSLKLEENEIENCKIAGALEGIRFQFKEDRR